MLIAPTQTPPAVSLDSARAQVRVDGAQDDDLIGQYIAAATMAAEHELARALVTQIWTLKLDRFPIGAIELARPPVQSVSSIQYLDSDGVEQTLDPTAYTLCADPLAPVITGTWPEGTNIVVTFTAGYGDVDSVPESIRAWILLHVGALYANREAVGAPVTVLPFVGGLLDRYRVVRAS